MLGGLATGAKGSIGNGFNFAAGVYQRLRRAFFAGDLATARLEQGRANLTIDMMNSAKYGGNGLATSRLMYEMKGTVKLGPPRAPIVALNAEQAALLKADLDACGFFGWADVAASASRRRRRVSRAPLTNPQHQNPFRRTAARRPRPSPRRERVGQEARGGEKGGN